MWYVDLHSISCRVLPGLLPSLGPFTFSPPFFYNFFHLPPSSRPLHIIVISILTLPDFLSLFFKLVLASVILCCARLSFSFSSVQVVVVSYFEFPVSRLTQFCLCAHPYVLRRSLHLVPRVLAFLQSSWFSSVAFRCRDRDHLFLKFPLIAALLAAFRVRFPHGSIPLRLCQLYIRRSVSANSDIRFAARKQLHVENAASS